MRTPGHPDRPVSFEGLVVPVNRCQALRAGMPFFPRAGIADRANRVGSDVAVALVMPKGHARRIVGEREEPRRFVDREASVVAKLWTGAALEGVLVHGRSPVPREVESRCGCGR